MYLLDTNTLIYFFTGHEAIARRLAQNHASRIKIPAVAVFELEYGRARSSRPQKQKAQLDAVLAVYELLPLDLAAAERTGRLRANLESLGRPIGVCDQLIAGIALAHQLTVVTRNTREFSRVPGLQVENWYD